MNCQRIAISGVVLSLLISSEAAAPAPAPIRSTAPAPAPVAAAAKGTGFLEKEKHAGDAVAGAVTSAADKVADAATNAYDSVHDKIAGNAAPGPLAAAPAPRGGPAAARATSNLVFSLTGASAKFTNNTLTIDGASPAVTSFSTVPTWHAGAVNMTFFTSKSLVYNTTWLGDPDAALYGTDKSGKKAVVLVTIGEPALKGDKVTSAAYHLSYTATPLLKAGIVDGLIDGMRAGTYVGPRVIDDPSSSLELDDVAL